MTAAPWGKHHAGGRWLAFRNDSGETIPAFAVMRITGVVTIEGRAVLTVAKPNADSLKNVLFNSSASVSSGGYGSGTYEFPCYAKYQTSSSAVLNDEWGTANGLWALKKDNTGFAIIGGETADRVIVRNVGGEGGGPAMNLAVATLVTDKTHSMPSVECVVRYTLSGSFPSGNLTIQNVPHSNDGTVITSYVFEGTSGATALIHDKLHTAVLAPEHGAPVADGSFIWVTCPTREPEEPPTQQQMQGDTSGSPPPQIVNPGGAFFG